MEIKEVNIKIIPSEYDKLIKMADKKGQSVEELVFDFINTDKYSILPKWFMSLFIPFIGIFFGSLIFYLIKRAL